MEEIMSKVRIIERVAPDGRKDYVIQQRHFLFRWQWVDGWINSWCGAACQDSWPTLAEAQAHLCWFDGTKCKETVMPNNRISESGKD
jgi:hypothetical protein